jgi:hypothetical protein
MNVLTAVAASNNPNRKNEQKIYLMRTTLNMTILFIPQHFSTYKDGPAVVPEG